MLGKLLKHEFKAQYKMYGAIYLAVLLIGVVSCIAGIISDKFPKNVIISSFAGVALVMAIIAIVAVFIMTLVLSIYRYYINLIKDQGYLMHTLPVPAFNHHIAKLILPIFWFAADCLVTFVMIILLTRDLKFEWVEEVRGFITILGIDMSAGNIILMVFYMLIGVISSLSMFYACLNVGSLSNSNKGVMAFVAYLVFYMVNQIISLIGLFVFMGILVIKNGGGIDEMLAQETPPEGYFSGIMLTTVIISVICIILYSVVSHYVLTKKVNLE